MDEDVIRTIFMRHVNSQPQMSIQGLATCEVEQSESTAVEMEIYSSEPNDHYLNDLMSRLTIEPSVSGASWESSTYVRG